MVRTTSYHTNSKIIGLNYPMVLRPELARTDPFPSVAFKIDTPEAGLADGGLTACTTLTLGGTSASPPTMDFSEGLINCIMLLPEGPMHGHGARPTGYVWMGRQGICIV